jgi:hypothetical protein
MVSDQLRQPQDSGTYPLLLAESQTESEFALIGRAGLRYLEKSHIAVMILF